MLEYEYLWSFECYCNIYIFNEKKKMDDIIQAINYAPNKNGCSMLRPNQRTLFEHYMKVYIYQTV